MIRITREERKAVPFQCEICSKPRMIGWKFSYEIREITSHKDRTITMFICEKCAPTEAHFTDPALIYRMLTMPDSHDQKQGPYQ